MEHTREIGIRVGEDACGVGGASLAVTVVILPIEGLVAAYKMSSR